MNVVKLEHHLQSIKEKHDQLEKQIKDQYDHREDDTKIKELKLRKLKLKEEMEIIKKKIA